MNINDLTFIKNPEDLEYLHRKLFDVNIRLLKSSSVYKDLISKCCDIISKYALTTLKGYSKPYGMSGANLAIPYNIIAIVKNRGKEDEHVDIMINPKICGNSIDKVSAQSNCGSIRLSSPIDITRWASVTVSWYDINGNRYIHRFDRKDGSLTIQHEIDHNNGILIIDRLTTSA